MAAGLYERTNREKSSSHAGWTGWSRTDKSASHHYTTSREVVEKYVAHQGFAAAHREFRHILTECKEEIRTAAGERIDLLSRPSVSHSFGDRRGEDKVAYSNSLASCAHTLESIRDGVLKNVQEVEAWLEVAVQRDVVNSCVHALTAEVTRQSQYLQSALHAMRESKAEADRRYTGGKMSVRQLGQQLESRRRTPPAATDPRARTAAAAALRSTSPSAAPATPAPLRPPTPARPAHPHQRTSDPRGSGRR
ncbi:hypothetical protein [Streptomyces sp. SLBN-115]|uniref:hypothetical protein n=1 Tax=Streptomyces sp. SLBN-115 TaxID=2768453 RepID=UPI0011530852|nr:hypothetical protein [Streptomyces sp. SLBN-115]TQJ46533.1 hypothetical protein FBY34_5929 [Streptomyces sp. SLBN-115]